MKLTEKPVRFLWRWQVIVFCSFIYRVNSCQRFMQLVINLHGKNEENVEYLQ